MNFTGLPTKDENLKMTVRNLLSIFSIYLLFPSSSVKLFCSVPNHMPLNGLIQGSRIKSTLE